jgi:hypothetical protein
VRSSVSNFFRNTGTGRSSMAGEPKSFPFATLISMEQRLRMMRDAANAISFLHAKNYMHCDIKVSFFALFLHSFVMPHVR